MTNMNVIETNLKDAVLITTKKYQDERGFFMESFNLKEIEKITGTSNFVQDNHSKSSKGVLRGLHYQIQNPQGKLVRCISGSVYDVIVDLRKSSPTFGKWYGVELNRNNLQLWVPPGFAHGFYTMTETAEFVYKTTDYYYPEHERSLKWDDEELNITWWCMNHGPFLSKKDQEAQSFKECEKYD